jgi:hypothetical protein
MSLSLVLLALPTFAKYEAHEWGTFTSVVDSTGVTQNGMYHEDEALPKFVHGFGELRVEAALPPTPVPVNPRPPGKPKPPRPPCHSKVCFSQEALSRNVITQKMETPVVYFYSDQAQVVKLNVKFPEGIITETYPGPVFTFPTMSDPHIIGKGESQFVLNILNTKTGSLPFVEKDNIYGHARAVNSNLINSGAETEKFLFYRGLGRFQPKISITSKDGNLKIGKLDLARPQAAFLIHVDAFGHGQLLSLDSVKTKHEVEISAKLIQQLKNHEAVSPFIIKGEQARGKLIDELVLSGLYKDEAIAMINTWENGYLKVPGLRLLYILPRSEVDEILPLTLSPAPEKFVRSFVARMEILLDTEEQQILADITEQQYKFRPAELGRFAEPILHRIRAIAQKSQPENTEFLKLMDALLKESAGAKSGTLK